MPDTEQLTPRQQTLLQEWLPRAEVARNHSWGLVGTTVLEMVQVGERYIVKAGDENDHHLARELRAHRNWLQPWYERGRAPQLVHDGVVRAIDFGRADLRPASTDFARLASRQFRADPELERAFLDGYGGDPRTPDAWRRTQVREAIGTAVWAYLVGDEAFEQQGHRMVDEALALGDSGLGA